MQDSGLAAFIRGLPRWLSLNWWVIFFPAALWAIFAFLLPETIPGDPRNGPADKVANDVAPEIASDLDDVSQIVAEAKAVDTADKALDESFQEIANSDVSLLRENDVKAAVGVAVADVIEADPQLKEASVSSIQTGVANSLVDQLTMLPESIADALPTPLEAGVKEELADKAVVEVFATLEDQDVQLEDAASQAATNAVAAIDIPANVNEEDLTEALAEEVAKSVIELGDRVTSDVSERTDIAEGDAEAVAGAIAEDVNEKIDDIVDEVVKTGVDPGDSKAVEAIAQSILRESIVGADTQAATAPVVAEAINDRDARLESIQRLGAGSLSGLRDLVSKLVWKVAIGIPAAWVLFRFFWEHRRPTNTP